ncbi:MAG TPA: chromate transporter [Candidatus Atribacteria bacterium]|nr:chromate transporter [Candidatus Atribacteria bacterium]HPZ81456.1 chromate transporter [Candidatus Atribacteria bacterium]HQE25474.1 chromate transporter [Candidatus Atribacteria bacterium]
MALPEEKETTATLFSLFFSFFKIGIFTWGGGYAMLPLIKREIVEKKKVLTDEEFIEGLSVAQSLPGAVAINTACFVGRKVRGIAGMLVSVLGASLPSFLIILLITSFFLQYRQLEVVQNFFRGATPAIVALIAGAVVDIGKSALNDWEDLIIAFFLFFLLFFLELHPLWIVLIGGILGVVRRK